MCSPSILEPSDDLGVGESKRLRNLVPISGREIFLIEKPFLQLVDLLISESRPRLAPLFRWLRFAEQMQMVATFA